MEQGAVRCPHVIPSPQFSRVPGSLVVEQRSGSLPVFTEQCKNLPESDTRGSRRLMNEKLIRLLKDALKQ
ncbi:MAG: hypothetical protein A4E19_20750 [Nitrospira sp. SG-bin1]|nr:MAG: hypothetical protein A4E19_20750 [Nitrospira sp. SG-bin1]